MPITHIKELGTGNPPSHPSSVLCRPPSPAKLAPFPLQIRENLYLYPSITDLGEFRAESNTALLFPVSTKLQLRLDLLVEYDNSLPFNRLDHWQTAVGAGLQVDF